MEPSRDMMSEEKIISSGGVEGVVARYKERHRTSWHRLSSDQSTVLLKPTPYGTSKLAEVNTHITNQFHLR